MLLNKMLCLDKGYVAFISASNSGKLSKEIRDEFFKSSSSPDLNSFFKSIGSLTIAIRCPLFVQLNLSKFSLDINIAPDENVEAYLPDLSEVGTKDFEDSKVIADDIMRTTEALLINPKAYQHDGCDKFVSQVITPINIYTTLIAHGKLNNWLTFCKQANLPRPIEVYRKGVEDIIRSEWNIT